MLHAVKNVPTTRVMNEAIIEQNSRVTLHYTLKTGEGRVAESTLGGEPQTITLGQDDIIPGLEKCLLGLAVGDKQSFEIACFDAFGPVEADEDTLQVMPRSEFPAEIKLEPGLVMGFATPNGREIPGTVVEIDDDNLTVDFTHPLAGYDLVFEVEILAIEPGQSA